MRVEVANNPTQSRYEARAAGKPVGFIRYREDAGRITLYHTEVDPGSAGQGVGSELARLTLEDMRARGLEVVPTCPFVAAYIRRHHDDYLSLVTPSMREKVMEGSSTG